MCVVAHTRGGLSAWAQRGVSRGIGYDWMLIVVEKVMHRAVIEKDFLVAQCLDAPDVFQWAKSVDVQWLVWLLGGVFIWIWCHFDVVGDEESVGVCVGEEGIAGECDEMQMQDLYMA